MLRIIGLLVLIAVGASLAIYLLFGRDRRYLRFAWQVTKYGLVMVGIVLAFMVLERSLMAV